MAYLRSWFITPLFFNLGTRRKSVANFTPRPLYLRTRMQVPTEWETGWAPETVGRFWRREKSPAHIGIRIPDRTVCSLAIMPITRSSRLYLTATFKVTLKLYFITAITFDPIMK
jgi:hypothetical protein